MGVGLCLCLGWGMMTEYFHHSSIKALVVLECSEIKRQHICWKMTLIC